MAVERQRVIQSAEKLVRRGRLEAAIREYRKVLDDTPDDTTTLNRVGDLYARLGKVERAIELFSQAARHFSREGFFVKAIAIYKKIIRIDPTQIKVYETLAELYHRQGLTNEARSQYQVVADYYGKAGDSAAVLSIFQKMIEIEPDNPSHRLRLAELHTQAGAVPEALEQYRRIASLLLSHERVDEAVRVYSEALELESNDLGFITDAVLEIRAKGGVEPAERLLEEAVARNPEAARIRELPELGAAPEPAAAEEPAAELEPEAAAGPEVPVADAEPAEPPVAAPAEEGEEEEEVEEEEALVLDLEELDETLPFATPVAEGSPPEVAAPAEPPAPEVEEFEIELGDLEAEAEVAEPEVVEEVAEVAPPGLDELLSEAKVLANYGLEDKAIERFHQVLQRDPRNLLACRNLIELHLAAGRHEQVSVLASRAAILAGELGQRRVWEKLEETLVASGYGIEGLKVRPPEPAAEPAVEPLPAVEEPAPEPAAAAEPPVEVEEPPAELEEPVAVEEGGLDWLESLKPERREGALADDELFGAEEEFFDLASELESELKEEEARLGERLAPRMEEQSLEEIVEGFKKGVAESLSAEDYDTHYNLGIAYREMGLVDEAIGEFQLASKDPRYLVDCCSLLAACFMEKGFEELAIKWYRRGLDSPHIGEDEMLGLLYELGNVYMAMGEIESARETFVEIYGTNSNYRDVVAKLEELRDHD